MNDGISHSGDEFYCYEPRVAIVVKPCQGCMRVHVYYGFVMGGSTFSI